MKTIGVVGVGIMGRGIADNFLKNGYKVVIWNRSPDKTEELESKGAQVVATPKQVAENADILIEVTADDESSRNVWFGEDGILAGATAEHFLITCATLSVEWVEQLADKCAELKFSFCDMPMTGGRMGAVSGQLILLASGDESLVNMLKKDLGAIAKDIKYFGPVGSGTKYKLILNSLQAVHATAFGEAINMAKEIGLDIQAVGDSLSELPGGYTTKLSWQCYQDQPNPINFSINWLTKDLDYASKMTNHEFPLMNQAKQKFDHVKKLGHGEDDWTIVNKIDE